MGTEREQTAERSRSDGQECDENCHRSWQGQFDPAVFQAFVKSVGIYPVGTLVKLQSGRLAVVLEQNQANLVAPRVKIFFSTKSKMPIPLLTLDLSRSDANDRIVCRELASEWGFTNLDELWRQQS